MEGARPTKLVFTLNKSSFDGILLHISNDALQFITVTNPMIKRFVLPKMSCSFQYPVGLERAIPFDCLTDASQRYKRINDYVNMVCHYGPREQLVELELSFAVVKSVYDKLGDLRLFKPERACLGSVEHRIGLKKISRHMRW